MKITTKKLTVKAPVKVATQKVAKNAKIVSKPATKLPEIKAAKVLTPSQAKTENKIANKPVKTDRNAMVEPKVKTAAKKQKVKIDAQDIAAKSPKNVTKLAVQAKVKAGSKPKVTLTNSNSPMPITSKITVSESPNTAQASPAASKARISRLAQLTVPSMAQTVASTAAKSSYAPASPSQALFAPPQFVAKQNPKLANNWKTKTAEELTDAEVLAMPNAEYMNIKQMMFFRLKLSQLKKEILESAGATTEHLRDESAVVPDPTDRATIEEEHALELRTRDRERKLLKKIEQSISRIDAGDYGYCDETGEPIGVGRLLARPTATLSLEAQQRRELKQKMFGD